MPPGFGSLFRLSTGHGVQGSEKVNHSPLLRRDLRACLHCLILLFTGLLLALSVPIFASPLPAQSAQVSTPSTRKTKIAPQPQYPELARRNNIQGSARLEVVVAP